MTSIMHVHVYLELQRQAVHVLYHHAVNVRKLCRFQRKLHTEAAVFEQAWDFFRLLSENRLFESKKKTVVSKSSHFINVPTFFFTWLSHRCFESVIINVCLCGVVTVIGCWLKDPHLWHRNSSASLEVAQRSWYYCNSALHQARKHPQKSYSFVWEVHIFKSNHCV